MSRVRRAPEIDGPSDKLRAALTGLDYEATLSDLVAATALPVREVERTLARLSRKYGASQRVTSNGDVLYRFPHAFRRPRRLPEETRGLRGALRRISAGLLGWAAERWPLLFLGGYFLVFLALPFPPALIVLAVILSTWSDIDFPELYMRSGVNRGEMLLRLHDAVHAYLFGRGPSRSHVGEGELLGILSYVRRHKGIISLEEVMRLTGRSPGKAREYLGRMLVDYRGEPSVTAAGTVVYDFDELMRTARPEDRTRPLAAGLPVKAEESAVSDGTNRRKERLISLVNYGNLLFAAYYGSLSFEQMTIGGASGGRLTPSNPGSSTLFHATYSLLSAAHIPAVLPVMFFALGIVPFSFATTFFVLHRRALRRKSELRHEASERQLRKRIYARVFSRPGLVDPEEIASDRSVVPRSVARQRVAEILDELAVAFEADIDEADDGHYLYRFPLIEIDSHEVEELRSSIDPSHFETGPIIFDSQRHLQ